jgi:hypothetical protein
MGSYVNTGRQGDPSEKEASGIRSFPHSWGKDRLSTLWQPRCLECGHRRNSCRRDTKQKVVNLPMQNNHLTILLLPIPLDIWRLRILIWVPIKEVVKINGQRGKCDFILASTKFQIRFSIHCMPYLIQRSSLNLVTLTSFQTFSLVFL